jgi:hypothetical protein
MTYHNSVDDAIPQHLGRLHQRPTSRNQFGYFADRPRPAKAPTKTGPPAKPVAPDWHIVPAPSNVGYGLVFPWPIQASDALKFVFVDGQLPPGFRLEKDRAGKSERWRLFIPRAFADTKSNAEKYKWRLADALRVKIPNMTPFAEELQRHTDESGAQSLLKDLRPGMPIRKAVTGPIHVKPKVTHTR